MSFIFELGKKEEISSGYSSTASPCPSRMHWRNLLPYRSNQTRQCQPRHFLHRGHEIQAECPTLAWCSHIMYNKQGFKMFSPIDFRLKRDQGHLHLNCCTLRTVLTFWDPRRKAKRTRHIGRRTRQQLRLRTDAEALLTHNPSWTNIARVRLQGEKML